MTGYVDPTKEAFAAFRADDRPGPIHMLNLVRLRPRAAYPDGREGTGAEAYAAIKALEEEHPEPDYRRWMAVRARERATRDADEPLWTVEQVRDFSTKGGG